MYLLYEEDGDIKVGSILSETPAALQIESQFGKRGKLKAAHVLLRFAAPTPAEALEGARGLAAELDPDFLWEVAGTDEFGFETIAADYWGHPPTPAEAGAVLLKLHEAPIYFHKKGKGRYRAAPAEVLAAAKAGLERRAREAEQRAVWVDDLIAGRLPEAFATQVFVLLHRPDKNTLLYKALDEACTKSGQSALHIFQHCGAIASPHEFHLQGFLLEHFPKGTGFPVLAELTPPPDLPPADAPAFSIDDAETTEIDDAFSVIFRPEGGARVGIHIACPALGIAPESDLDKVAGARLSTVYMPGHKITMLPDALVQSYTLAEGRACPALSLYVEVGADYAIRSVETRVDQVTIAANLRHERLEPLFNDDTIGNPGAADYPFRRELEWLWNLATQLEAARGKADQVQRHDYIFKVDGERVEIKRRLRGNPIDKLVSELMILANSRWGALLDEAGVPGIYRVQGGGKVRMQLQAAPHEGLGLDHYAWSSSPLRRYVDLVNQRQILAVTRGEPAAYAKNDTRLFAVLRGFELAYDAYNEHQRRMERYWCLRWLTQEGVSATEASVIRENLVRIDGLPLVLRMTGAPALNPGDRVRVQFGTPDLLDIEVPCQYEATLTTAPSPVLLEA
jgi:exoribonuclease-2